jgi:SAM-dependent methyltransferase
VAYGHYILRTGGGLVGEFENVLGAFFYQSRFAGRSPVLDLAPGRCWFARQNPAAILAVDNSPELVDHYSRTGINIRLGDAYELPVAENHLEGVFCCWLLEHLSDPQRALSEIYRVLRADGYALVIVPTPHDMNTFYDDYTHLRPFTPTSLKQLAEDAGFTRHRELFFPFTRGAMHVLRYFGPKAAMKYLRFSDRVLRRVGIVNRNNLMLEAWK